MQIGHPATAEIFGRLGYDWICVDLEHGVNDLESMAGSFARSKPQARSRWRAFHSPTRFGLNALWMPALHAIRQAKYPPVGERGFGCSRANRHGLDFEPYIKEA